MRLIPLSSGSKGNATLVELGGARVLVDAGLSARELGLRLTRLGIPPASIDALVLSHEHEDHARGVERFSRVHGIPVYCAPETLQALDLSPVHLARWCPLPEARPIEIGPVTVLAFPVPHDAVRPVGFVLSGEGLRVGIATDLGHATQLVVQRLIGCDVLMIEFNHDDRMLRDGPYPWALKQRVASRLGHLSNGAAADLLRRTVGGTCRVVILAHLSERNNTPDLACRSAARALADAGQARVVPQVAGGLAPVEVQL